MKIVHRIAEALRSLNQSKGAQDLTGYIAHGATEAANLLVHGHAAPMYAHGTSPPELESLYGKEDFDKHNQDAERRDAEQARSKLERASQGMKSRMEAAHQPQEQERSR
jgi:hypothetical protein